MKEFIFSILILAGTFNCFSQDTYFNSLNEKSEVKADSLTTVYSPKLGLTGKQELLFKTKVAQFLMQRAKVEKEYSDKEKLEVLVTVDNQENAEMLDILTKPQFEKYKQIKGSIQPLARVEKN